MECLFFMQFIKYRTIEKTARLNLHKEVVYHKSKLKIVQKLSNFHEINSAFQ